MASVFIDGEIVEFEGKAPLTCREACEFIEAYLTGQGLVIESVSVDGEKISLEEAFARGAYERIELGSTSPQAQLLAACRQWERDCLELAAEMERLSGRVLQIGWADAQSAVVTLLENLRPLIEGLEILRRYGQESSALWGDSVSSRFDQALASIDVLVTAVESMDCVSVSDQFAEGMAVRWGAVSDSLATEVIPALEGGAAL